MKESISQVPCTLVRPTRTELVALFGDGWSRVVVDWSTNAKIEARWLVRDSTPAPLTVAVVLMPSRRAVGTTVWPVNCR